MIGKRLSHLLKYGRLRWLGKPLYEGLIAAELAWIRWRERESLSFAPTPLVDGNLTAIVKTFERPKTLRRLIDSIRRCYPNLRVIVADDSKTPSFFEGMQTIALPYDSGVSLGRQRALEAVETPYVLLLDDDFIFYRETKLEEALQRMEKNRQIDIMGGEVVNLPSFKALEYKNAGLHPTESRSLIAPGTLIDGMPVYDKVPNFYIARTERLRLVGWDPRIKRLDHADFFTRAKGVLLTVMNKELKVLHAQTPHNRAYMQKRHDIQQDRTVLRMKYYLGRL
ncbi:glycosyltransferase [Nitratifractor sp.]|uniref:glycosyltransferase n=1 Tax=Nitratifractor sp. TaxID=2268144 RepID=UPI0025D41ED4|nr:glycosyltransferase [Nitratifractor sp.]